MSHDGTTLPPPPGVKLLRSAQRAARDVAEALRRGAPSVVTVMVALSGMVLLLSGVSPALDARMRIIGAAVPLPAVEVSHLAGSLAGFSLLILARGLARRLAGACTLSLAALAVGMVASVLKGGDVEEASVLAATAALLFASRQSFHRRSRLSALPFSPGWFVLIAIAIGASVGLGLFAHRDVAYSHALWWDFAFNADAPRFLRATALVAIAALGIALYKLLRTGITAPAKPTAAELDEVERIVAGSRASEGTLALTGDKAILFSADREAFVMYGASGRSFIAFGDPIGPDDRAREMIRAFRNIADRAGARPVFYQVDGWNLERYVDLGFTCLKLGEEAHVDLHTFDLKGKVFCNLRNARSRATRDGLVIEVVPREAVRPLLAELRAVSDAWLAQKKAREKGFTLGFFSEDYLCRTPVAVVRQGAGGPVVAFANLLIGADREEVSIDMMRHVPGTANGTMDFLFVEIAFWAKASGFRWFNLGLAPLSGLLDGHSAPLWHRLGCFVFSRFRAQYNFAGLRAYKEKFQPVWRSKYLAAPSNADAYAALLDATALVAGGIRGIFAR